MGGIEIAGPPGTAKLRTVEDLAKERGFHRAVVDLFLGREVTLEEQATEMQRLPPEMITHAMLLELYGLAKSMHNDWQAMKEQVYGASDAKSGSRD